MIATGNGSVPMSGDPSSGRAQPALPLDPSVADPATLESWACLEVTPKSNGTLDNTCLIQIVHRNSPFSTNPLIGRQPLALILWTANQKPGQIFDQTWFNLRYYRTTPAPGAGVAQHFFL
jgi:hypothetical protein